MDTITDKQPVPKVSVIMPVYNTERYVAEAIAVITHQTLKDIEIILVNDGSTDTSLQIISSIATTDHRIRVVSKKNEGPSEARNMGLEMARGSYIYFMDSDDLLEKDALQTCYDRCEQNKLDFAFFDATAFKEDKSESLNDYYLRTDVLNNETIYTGEDVLTRLMQVNLYRSAVWLCFIRRSYLDEIKLRFYSGIIHEDELFTGVLHVQAQRVNYIPTPFFRRRIRPNSITSNRFTTKNMSCYYIVLAKLKEYALGEGRLHQTVIDQLCAYILNPAIYRASAFSFDQRMQQLNYCRNNGLMRYITTKNKLVLVCPFLTKLKSIIKPS
ncbi:MAG: hypothetical protein RL662_1173 [Bacteroidota bacterium]|jgi:glycosyltransferase involved in cell wall biosynthesis